MKALLWKEWRESRTLLFVGIPVGVGFSLIPLVYGVEGSLVLGGITIIFLAGLFGADAFSKEKGKLEFLLSCPVGREKVLFAKLLLGFLNILVLVLIASAIEFAIYRTDGFGLLISAIRGRSLPPGVTPGPHISEHLATFLFPTFLFYSVAFFVSILLQNSTTAFLAGFAIVTVTQFILSFGIWKIFSSQPDLYRVVLNLADFVLLLFFFFVSYIIFTRKELRE